MDTNGTFKSARHPDELAAAAASMGREFDRLAREAKTRAHADAIRENEARRAAASLGIDFDAFMAEEA